MTDLDRRCAGQRRELLLEIKRTDRLMLRYASNRRYGYIKEKRNRLLGELHDMQRAHRAYDDRLADAMDDPTGQDQDNFQYSE